MMDTHYEKHLSRDEVEERTKQLVELFSSQESLSAEFDGFHRDLRAARRRLRELDGRVRVVSREIRSGVSLLPRQQEIPTEGDLCEPVAPSKFDQLYPVARTHPALFEDLRACGFALAPGQIAALNALHEDSGKFEAIANWARVGRAREEWGQRGRKGEAPIAGLTVPLLPPAPEAWAEVVNAGAPVAKPAKKATRGARPLTSKKKRAKG